MAEPKLEDRWSVLELASAVVIAIVCVALVFRRAWQ